jgi:hypothetical protein
MEKQPWFHGQLSRPDAESRLEKLGSKDGLFLVRQSPRNPGVLVLSVCYQMRDDTGKYHIDGGPKFVDVNTLISFYRSKIEGLPIQLKNHCPNRPLTAPHKNLKSYESVWLATSKEQKEEETSESGEQLGRELNDLVLEDEELVALRDQRKRLMSTFRRSKKAIHEAVKAEEEANPSDPDSRTKHFDQVQKIARMSQSTEEKVYLQWMNSHLKDEGISLQNLQSDIQTAIPVLRVLEILSGRPSPSHAKSHLTPIQINDNWHVVLQFMRKLRIPCDSLDADGKHKQLSKLLSTDKS